MNNNFIKASTVTLLAASVLTGCLNNQNNKSSQDTSCVDFAIQTTAADHTSSAVTIGCLETLESTDRVLVKGKSDYDLSAGTGVIYHIGKFGIDTLDKYQAGSNINGGLADWSYSTIDTGVDASSNTYKVLEVSPKQSLCHSLWKRIKFGLSTRQLTLRMILRLVN